MRFRFAIPVLSLWIPVVAANLTVVAKKSGLTRPEVFTLPTLEAGEAYGLLYSTDGAVADTRISVDLEQSGSILLHKTLHLGDPDFYADFRTAAPGPAKLVIRTEGMPTHYRWELQRWPSGAPVKAGPAHDPAHAIPAQFERTIFASGDETPYIPVPGTPRDAALTDPLGADWYRFHFDGGRPKLAFFQLELAERDNIPVDVSVFRLVNGKPQGYYEDEDPVSFPHEVQALQGNKFVARVLREPGDYYVCVRANHPEYKLRTHLYDVPPYSDPKEAVRTALDFILAAGDSWHANTPRRGGVLDRIEPVHQETSLCVACHPTHFSQRAVLYAARNGYAIRERQQLEFLAERFYNNTRPFYGFEKDGATWSRVISSPANVMSRMSHLMTLFESQVSGEPRQGFHEGVAAYLKLYYREKDKLPPDETNGNTPLVSAYEVAWYSWTVLREPKLERMIAGGEVKNMVDLCYQTLALAEIDATKFHDLIAENVERIFSLQRPSGQWSMRFDPKQPEVEFQTGHVLWALHAAGVPKEDPHVAKAIAYLMKRQQAFGGWMDPLQSFENFRTPFRETQMAILALSAYYPDNAHKKGWDADEPAEISSNPGTALEELDRVWTKLPHGIDGAATSNNVLVRQAAAEAMGRVASKASLKALTVMLGDRSKLVQRTAAWAIRNIYSRRDSVPAAPLMESLSPTNEGVLAATSSRTRWGATRVFATHFSRLAHNPDFARALITCLDAASPAVRMEAARALWQFWFWTPDTGVKIRIEDAFLAAMGRTQHDWVDLNLRRGIYNIADENIRYLYNNWVPLMGREQDRERAINGRLAIESRLASKFAQVLDRGTEKQKLQLLAGLTEFPLRRADVYDLKADLSKPAPPVYNRIGNDIEQIAFFGDSAERFAKAVAPLLDAKNPELRRLAAQAAQLVREVRFPDVNTLAGERGSVAVNLVAKAIPPAPKSMIDPKTGTRSRPATKLDDSFFRGYVQPILEKRGKDGYACVQCHASHSLFDATLSTVRNVVDTDNPENSLILRKPTSSSETEGIAGSQTLAHGGGVRFEKNSPEYLTILEWIKGAKE